MVPYIFIFTLSYIFSYLSETAYKRKSRTLSILFGILVVISISVFAGIRDYGVGTDIATYIIPYYKRARLSSRGFMAYVSDADGIVEIGFLFLEYLAANVFRNPHFVMLVLALLTNGFIYLGLTKQRGKMSVPSIAEKGNVTEL